MFEISVLRKSCEISRTGGRPIFGHKEGTGSWAWCRGSCAESDNDIRLTRDPCECLEISSHTSPRHIRTLTSYTRRRPTDSLSSVTS